MRIYICLLNFSLIFVQDPIGFRVSATLRGIPMDTAVRVDNITIIELVEIGWLVLHQIQLVGFSRMDYNYAGSEFTLGS